METLTTKTIIVISIDTELIWSYPLNPEARGVGLLKRDNGKSYRVAVDSLLYIFEKYDIQVTWAIAGHVFLDHCDREEGIAHKGMPRFRDDWYSQDPCSDIHQAPMYYGRDIVEKILSSPIRHEIGYHSFSHVPFSECSWEVAEAEVKEGVRLAKQFGIKLESFVFPYNKIGHLDVLREQGFRIYRGETFNRSDIEQKTPIRMANTAMDKIIARPVEPVWRDGIWEIPGSVYFSDSRWPFGLTLASRCKLGIERAIRENKVFHIWFHPMDLLTQPLTGHIDRLLNWVSKRRDEGKIQVMTMGELAFYLNDRRGE